MAKKLPILVPNGKAAPPSAKPEVVAPKVSTPDSTPGDAHGNGKKTPAQPAELTASEAPKPASKKPAKALMDAISEAKDDGELYNILLTGAEKIVADSPVGTKYHLFTMYSESSIGRYYADRIYTSLRATAAKRDKPVMLLLVSNGGSVEPAYLISKACKEYAKDKFIVAVPRNAKSAATLLALGADELHMGTMSELGPIDPQIGGVPALALKQALENVSELCEAYPKAQSMFSEYLAKTLDITKVGYYERISKSAAQYAERLLRSKFPGKGVATQLASKLVYEYKDHGFVIDHDEALKMFGDKFVRYETEENQLAERLHQFFESFDLWINIIHQKRLRWILGQFDRESVFIQAKED